jgi:hypothetical protein
MRPALVAVGCAVCLGCATKDIGLETLPAPDAGVVAAEPPPLVPAPGEECYDGPPETKNVGICRAGTRKCATCACDGQVLPSKAAELCGTFLDLDCDGKAPSSTCPGDVEFRNELADATISSVAVSPDGNVVVGGSGYIDTGSGGVPLSTGSGVFLAKFDPSGARLFTKNFPGSTSYFYPYFGSDGTRVAIDADGAIVARFRVAGTATAGLSIDVGDGLVSNAGEPLTVLAKFDAKGALLWKKTLPPWAVYKAVAIDQAKNVYASIATIQGTGTVDLGSGCTPRPWTGYSAMLASFGPTGACRWLSAFPESSGGELPDLDRLASFGSEVVAGGRFEALAGLGSDDPPPPIGAPYDFGFGSVDAGEGIFLVGIDTATGAAVWSKTYVPTPATDNYLMGALLTGLVVSPSGRWLATGVVNKLDAVDFGGGALVSSGRWDSFLFGLGAGGAYAISKRWAGQINYNVQPGAIAANATNVVLTASYTDTIDLGGGPLKTPDRASYVAKLTADGAHVWSHSLEATIHAVAIGPDGDVYAGGVGLFLKLSR